MQDLGTCCAAAHNPGHGAVWGAVQKNEAWLNQTRLQGGAFMPICHEVGGRQGAQASEKEAASPKKTHNSSADQGRSGPVSAPGAELLIRLDWTTQAIGQQHTSP